MEEPKILSEMKPLDKLGQKKNPANAIILIALYLWRMHRVESCFLFSLCLSLKGYCYFYH